MIEALTRLGNELGLAVVGVAPAIEEVRRTFGWAESVVVAAISYLDLAQDRPEPDCECDGPRALIARVARGADYHIVLREKLMCLASALSPGANFEVCVDTCPLPERKLAVLAGIAWRGKNGCVFVEGCGSYAALGEIVTDAKLPASQATDVDCCAGCDQCLRACPTGALIGPYTLEPGKCLSSVTQVSGDVPCDLRRIMGNRIYGCDVCQEACPQNANVRPVSPEFSGGVFPGAHPLILPLIQLSASEFKNRVKRSSIGWIGRTRIRRNAAIAAGNLRCGEAVPALTEMVRDESPILSASAAWALREIGVPRRTP